MNRRPLAFAIVGVGGFVVQMMSLALFTSLLEWPHALATSLAVEAAVVTNFCWHERWTWRDRPSESRLRRFWQFQIANGATSVFGNVILTVALMRAGVPHVLIANATSVVILSVANFLLADRWVFAARLPVAGAALLLLSAAAAEASGPGQETLDAWKRHVASVERTLGAPPNEQRRGEPEGRTIDVPHGTIHEWRGSTVVRGTTVAALVEALTHPGTPPPQDDVVESRVIEHHGQSLRVYLKLVRKAIVTVTYDTEHEVAFTVAGPGAATSRSVATRIAETGGDDRGFLWRLNSYWRYRQAGDDVVVDVLSLSLSRDVPFVLKPIAGPIVGRIARESMVKTLDAVRRFGEDRAQRQKGTA